jgi:hypothetical protein
LTLLFLYTGGAMRTTLSLLLLLCAVGSAAQTDTPFIINTIGIKVDPILNNAVPTTTIDGILLVVPGWQREGGCQCSPIDLGAV